ncbi:MAG: TatD family deoxyribonuclease [Dehalococcoidia bacterium]|nr:MAG: TatD family deoxyribonuclease [Dehalococcoidia bacterium]
MPVLVDSHTHIDMRLYNRDRDQVLERARGAGVAAVVDVGCDLDSSRGAIRLAAQYSEVFAALGFHPHSAAKMRDSDLERLSELAQHPKVVAIGEIGLDFYRNLSPREVQVEAFKKQLALARRLRLPVIVHCRDAQEEVLSILTEWAYGAGGVGGAKEPLGVLHCFSGDRELSQRYIEMGFLLSIAGPITYPSSHAMEIAHHIPLDKLLIETDCPFLTPQPYRGKRNEPSNVSFVAEKIGEIRGVPTAVVAEHTTANAAQLFRLPL